jgi:exonuclease VII small subunit
MTEPTALTFETGYDRLQSISQRVTSEDVPVSEMCDLFAEGKGLQTALTEYLDQQKSRVEAIERGEGIQAFRIVAPADGAAAPRLHSEPALDTGHVLASPSSSDDDIPF